MVEEVFISTVEEAQALSNFLWCEKQRHMDDMEVNDRGIDALKRKWNVTPRLRRVYVRP